MITKKHTLKFRAVNWDIFEAIRSGRKKVETRAATVKYQNIKADDRIVLSCDGDKFEKIVKSAKVYKSIGSLLKKYKPSQIVPGVKTAKKLEAIYFSFLGYKEKIKKSGLIALELK